MWRLFGKDKTPKQLSPKMKELLKAQYNQDLQTIERLRYVKRRGYYGARPVSYIKIFDPDLLVSNSPEDSLNYDHLSGHKEALRFDGHVDKDGTVHLVDRRQPVHITRSAKKSA